MSLLQHLTQFAAGPAVLGRFALAELLRVARAEGFEPGAYPLPDSANSDVPAGAGLDMRLSVPAGTYLIGFTAYSSQAAGFDLQLIDTRHNAPMWQSKVNWKNASNQSASPEGVTFPMLLLQRPRLVIEPGQLIIQVKNLAAVTNTIELVLFTVEPSR